MEDPRHGIERGTRSDSHDWRDEYLHSIAISLKRIADQGDQRNASREGSGPPPNKPSSPAGKPKASAYPSPQRVDREQTMQTLGLNADEIREMKK